MVDINYQLKLNDIKNLLIQWSKRIISPIGKNEVIKTLALSKINHLILSLPNPYINIINTLQNMFYSYLWGGCPDKVKMVTVVQGYEQGGLRVIDINKLRVALKITWLRRYFMYNTKYFQLVKVICPCISDFDKFSTDYSKVNLNAIDNVFWQNVIEGYIQFNNCLEIKTLQDFHQLPIWYNSLFKIRRQ